MHKSSGTPPIDDAPSTIPTACFPGQFETFDTRPTRRSGNHDDDDDGIPSDCDPDRDGDNVPNDEDNCPDDHNPDQRDQNDNGRGDACDLCNAGQPICHLDGNALPEFDPIDFGIGWDLHFECINDGPGCLGFLIPISPDGSLINAHLANAGIIPLDAQAYGGSRFRAAALLPDMTADGVPEIVLAVAQKRGSTLVAVDPLTSGIVWQHRTPFAVSAFAFDTKTQSLVAGIRRCLKPTPTHRALCSSSRPPAGVR